VDWTSEMLEAPQAYAQQYPEIPSRRKCWGKSGGKPNAASRQLCRMLEPLPPSSRDTGFSVKHSTRESVDSELALCLHSPS
jgi:hypothetical protein